MDIEQLEALALAAGVDHPWHWHSDPIKGDPLGRSRHEVTTLGRTITRTHYSDPTALHEAAFIAAFNPAVALELIAEIKRLRGENSGPGKARIDQLMYQHTGISERQFPDEYEDLKKFADALILEA